MPKFSVRPHLFLLLAMLVGGCFQSADNVDSKHIDPEAVYQMYAVTHHAEADGAILFARFRVGGAGGTNVELTPPAAVTGNGEPLAPKSGVILSDTLPGRYYQRDVRGFRNDHEFAFEMGGKTFRNTARLERADFAPDQPTEFARGKDSTLAFAGPPLRAGEVVSLVLTTTPVAGERLEPKKPLSAVATATHEGATAVTLPSAQLTELSADHGKMMWRRTCKNALQQGSKAGGEVEATYHSKPLAFTLVK
jgi:hypothetical protein